MIARAPRSAAAGHAGAAVVSRRRTRPTQPVLFLTLSSATLPLSQVDRYAETVLAQRLSMVSGVAQVNVFGAQKYAVRVDVDPTQLAARQIGIDEVAQAITGANVNRPTGTLYGPNRNFVVQASGQLMTRRAATGRSSSPTATAARCGSTRSRTSTTASRTAQRQLVQRHAGDLPRHPAAAGHQHRRGRRRDQGAAAGARRRSCRRRSSSRSAAIARSRSASRSTTSSSRCC